MADSPQLACAQCGGSFGLVALQREVTCPYCQTRQTLPEDKLARLRAYRETVDAEMQRIAEHGRHVAAADRFIESYSARGGAAGMFLFVVGTPAIAVAGFAAMQQVMSVSATVAAAYFVVVGLVTFLLSRVVFGAKASDSERVTVGAVPVACPECAAPGVLGAGGAVCICDHCGGQLVATAVAIAHGVQAAAQAERQAAIQKFRKEREVMLHVNRPGTFFKVYVVGSVFLALGAFVYVGAREGQPLIAGAVSGTLMAVLAGLVLRGVLRDRERKRALRDVAQQLRGTTHHGVPTLVAWLNRHWPARYPPQHLYAEAHLIDANTGFPTMIAMYDERIDVFLAADMSAKTGSREANQEKAWLQHLGFTVRTNEGGAWLEATPELRKKLSRDIPATRLLSTVVLHAARMLGAMGARAA